MKKLITWLSFFLLLAVSVWWYWGYHKKRIIKDLIQDGLAFKTDSLYYIRYDSSMIDEVNGNAYFRNIYLQSDSDQQAVLHSTDSLPSMMYNIYIRELSASGVDMPSALQQSRLHAKKIVIDRPLIQLISTGSNVIKLEDTIALYRKMVGEFKSIDVDSIVILNGTIIIRNRVNEKLTELSNTNIVLTKFKVDSTKDYSNVLSYFIDNVEAKVDNIAITRQPQGKFDLQDVHYNSILKTLSITKVKFSSKATSTGSISLNNLQLQDMDVRTFVEQHRIRTGKLSCDGGMLTLFTTPSTSTGKKLENKLFEFPDEFFDEIEIGSMSLGSTDLAIHSKKFPDRAPILIKNVRFSVLNETKMVEGNTLRHILSQANWALQADGFVLTTNDNRYDLVIKGIIIDRQTSTGSIKEFSMKPKLSEAAFVKSLKKQEDYYRMTISDIQLAGIHFNSFIDESAIDADNARMKVQLHVFTDRMLPANPDSKVGKFPHQTLMKLKMPIFLKKVEIKNSYISYRERALATQQVGDVFFDHVNATIQNLTNIPNRIAQNSVCIMDAEGLVLGKGKATTNWALMLDAKDGAFRLKGKLSPMSLSVLNSIGKPLGMTSVKGTMQELNFNMTGNDDKAQGSLVFLYKDLTMASYKMDEKGDSMRNNKIQTWLGNTLVINNNPSDGTTRSALFSSVREPNKSFFNLIWKSLFDGMKKTTLSKTGAKLQKQLQKKPK